MAASWTAKPLFQLLYGLTMVAVIVGVDVAFLRDKIWLRLAANVGVVILFGLIYIFVVRRIGSNRL